MAILVLLAGLSSIAAQPTPPSEHQVKAAIVANLPKYVDWPERVLASSNSPLVIEVAVPAHLEVELRKMTADKVVEGHPLEVRRFEDGAAIRPTPQILFISELDPKRAAEMLRRWQGQPVLTVVDGTGGAAEKGIITLFRKDNKIRFEICVATAQESGLAISSKLLTVADSVKGRTR